MTKNSQLSTNGPKRNDNEKKKKERKKLSKQPEQEQNQRNGHHMEDFQWEGKGRDGGGKVQGRRSITGSIK